MEHRRVLQDADAGVEKRRVVVLLRGRAGPVVRVGGDEQPDAHPRRAACSILRIIPRSVTYGLTTSSVAVASSRRRPIASVIGRNLPGALWSTVAGICASVVRGGQQLVERRRGHRAAEPAKAAEEDELELLHDGPGHAEEQVVEATVREVVFDPGAADPPDSSVDDHDLAVIDVTQRSQVPVHAAPGAEHAALRPRLRRAHHADLRARPRQALVEDARTAFGIGALPVDDEPDRNALAQLLDERVRELLPHRPGRKPNWLMWTDEDAERMSASIGG